MTILLIVAALVILSLLIFCNHQAKLIDGYKNMLGLMLNEIENMQVELSAEWEKERNENGSEGELQEALRAPEK